MPIFFLESSLFFFACAVCPWRTQLTARVPNYMDSRRIAEVISFFVFLSVVYSQEKGQIAQSNNLQSCKYLTITFCGGKMKQTTKTNKKNCYQTHIISIARFTIIWLFSQTGKLHINWFHVSFSAAKGEIRERTTTGQAWASNRESGNYSHRYISSSDSPEHERVLIQVM